MAPSANVALRMPPPEMHSALNGRDGSPPARMAAASSCRTDLTVKGSSGMGSTLYPDRSGLSSGYADRVSAGVSSRRTPRHSNSPVMPGGRTTVTSPALDADFDGCPLDAARTRPARRSLPRCGRTLTRRNPGAAESTPSTVRKISIFGLALQA